MTVSFTAIGLFIVVIIFIIKIVNDYMITFMAIDFFTIFKSS